MMRRLIRGVLALVALMLVGSACASPSDHAPISTAPKEDPATAASETDSSSAPLTLRVGSYNIAHGRECGFDMRTLAADIVDRQLDVVGLQEVDVGCSRSELADQIALLSEYTALPYYSFTEAVSLPGANGSDGRYGTAILSRYPLQSAASHSLPSGKYEPRKMGCAMIEIGDRIIHLYNTHLSYENADLRRTQLEELADRTRTEHLVIVTGDFNVDSMADFAPVGHLERAVTEDGHPVTFPSGGKSIDNILFSPTFALASRFALQTGHSDHCLLVAELTLSEN